MMQVLYRKCRDSEKMETKDKKEPIIYILTNTNIVILFIYYALIIIGGAIYFLTTMDCLWTMEKENEILQESFLYSVVFSGAFCSMRYIIKLYRACVHGCISTIGSTSEHIGCMAYFIFRPVFAIVLSVMMVFMMLSGMFAITGNLDYIVNQKFAFLCIVVSGVMGYSIGRTLDHLENFKISSIVGRNQHDSNNETEQ